MCIRATQPILHFAWAVLLCGMPVSHARAGQILKVWRTVYERLHPGRVPEWRGQDDAIDWAKAERERIEPIAMSIIRGEEPDIQWTAGLAIARHIPSPAICDLLLEKVELVVERTSNRIIPWNSVDERGLVNMLDILADQRVAAARPLVLQLAAQPGQSPLLIEHCLGALQKLGIREDIAVVRQVGSRRMNEHINRLCELTEKVVDARSAGVDILADAPDELRRVTTAWIAAIETKDMDAYVGLLPFAARGGVDDYDFKVELLESPDLPEMLDAARDASRQDRFDIDRDALVASVLAGEGYKLTYVYELEGWRVAGIRRIQP